MADELRPDPEGRHGRQPGRRGRARRRRCAAAGSPRSASWARPAGEMVDCTGPARPARRDRQPGAFPRARPRPTRKTSKPARAAPCWAASRRCSRCPTPIRRPPRAAALADKIARGHHRMHCDFAFYIGGTHENAARACRSWSGCPARAGIKVFMGSSTGSLLVEDDDGVRDDPQGHPPPRRVPFRGRIPAERAQASARRGRSASHPVWRDATAALMLARSGSCARARDRQARPCAAYLDRRGDARSWPTTRTSPPSR